MRSLTADREDEVAGAEAGSSALPGTTAEITAPERIAVRGGLDSEERVAPTWPVPEPPRFDLLTIDMALLIGIALSLVVV
jgi:hypothetical protein